MVLSKEFYHIDNNGIGNTVAIEVVEAIKNKNGFSGFGIGDKGIKEGGFDEICNLIKSTKTLLVLNLRQLEYYTRMLSFMWVWYY